MLFIHQKTCFFIHLLQVFTFVTDRVFRFVTGFFLAVFDRFINDDIKDHNGYNNVITLGLDYGNSDNF